MSTCVPRIGKRGVVLWYARTRGVHILWVIALRAVKIQSQTDQIYLRFCCISIPIAQGALVCSLHPLHIQRRRCCVRSSHLLCS